MPPSRMMTTPWLKEVLKGNKKLLRASDVKICNPPRYDEISVSNLYEHCIKMPLMAYYFADSYPKGRSCHMEYFFSVLNTLHPDYTKELLLKCKEERYGIKGEQQAGEAILLDPEWETQLKEFP